MFNAKLKPEQRIQKIILNYCRAFIKADSDQSSLITTYFETIIQATFLLQMQQFSIWKLRVALS